MPLTVLLADAEAFGKACALAVLDACEAAMSQFWTNAEDSGDKEVFMPTLGQRIKEAFGDGR